MKIKYHLADRIARLHDALADLHRRGKRTTSYRYLAYQYGLTPGRVRQLCLHVEAIERRGRG